MAFFLRKVDGGGRRWIEPGPPWPTGVIPADPFHDLDTGENALSVFRVNIDEDNVDRVLVALAAKSRYPDKPVAGLLFDETLPSSLGIKVEPQKGDTYDETVNSWHFSLVQLSADALHELLKSLWQKCEVRRKLRVEMVPLVREAKRAGRLSKVHENWEEKIG